MGSLLWNHESINFKKCKRKHTKKGFISDPVNRPKTKKSNNIVITPLMSPLNSVLNTERDKIEIENPGKYLSAIITSTTGE